MLWRSSAMRFQRRDAEVYRPHGESSSKGEVALESWAKTTHLGIVAHPDDLEIVAIHGVLECYETEGRSFAGVVISDGAGSARGAAFAGLTEEELIAERRFEQRCAADLGRYGAVALLGYPSGELKGGVNLGVVADLELVLRAACPEVLYTHCPFDRHPTHLAVLLHVLEAIARLPSAERPRRILGCEVWRDLDWLPKGRKLPLDVSAHPELQAALLEVYRSQIEGGKRYDRGVLGRRRAQATFTESHETDVATLITLAMDLVPLVDDSRNALTALRRAVLEEFDADLVSLERLAYGPTV